MHDGTEYIVRRWRIILLIRQGCKPYIADLILSFRAKMTYKVQNRQIVECIEMELVLRVYDLQAFVIDQAIRP
jgi:hypothetical protein